MKKASVDYDRCLSELEVQEYVKELIARGIEMWITTSRFDNKTGDFRGWPWIRLQNEELFATADRLGIPADRIQFTAMVDKVEVLDNKGFIFHLDDDDVEIDLLRDSDCSGVLYHPNRKEWKNDCEMCLLLKNRKDIYDH